MDKSVPDLIDSVTERLASIRKQASEVRDVPPSRKVTLWDLEQLVEGGSNES